MIYEIAILFFFGILGLVLASFGNMLAFRLKGQESLLTRSHCEKCKHTLGVQDLVPVFSYLYLRGKCRYCKKNISKREVLGEIFFATVSVVWGYLYINGNVDLAGLIVYMVFSFGVFVVAVSDANYLEIPDEMQILIVLAGIGNLVLFGDLLQVLLNVGFAAGLLSITFLITGDKKMGFGDVKLAFALGFFLNYFYFTLAILLSSIAGILFALVETRGNRENLAKYRVPYGSFLSLAALLILVVLIEMGYSPLVFNGLYL